MRSEMNGSGSPWRTKFSATSVSLLENSKLTGTGLLIEYIGSTNGSVNLKQQAGFVWLWPACDWTNSVPNDDLKRRGAEKREIDRWWEREEACWSAGILTRWSLSPYRSPVRPALWVGPPIEDVQFDRPWIEIFFKKIWKKRIYVCRPHRFWLSCLDGTH